MPDTKNLLVLASLLLAACGGGSGSSGSGSSGADTCTITLSGAVSKTYACTAGSVHVSEVVPTAITVGVDSLDETISVEVEDTAALSVGVYPRSTTEVASGLYMSGGKSWVAGTLHDEWLEGTGTLNVTSFVADPSRDPTDQPAYVVHGTADYTLVPMSGGASGTIQFHADF